MKNTKPGMYYALCNKMNGKDYYVKKFEFPQPNDTRFKIVGDEVKQVADIFGNCFEEAAIINASWYFLNVLDSVAWLEAVYPVELFADANVSTVPRHTAECSVSGSAETR